MRRLLTILLTIALLAGVFPASVLATDEHGLAEIRGFDVIIPDITPFYCNDIGYKYFTPAQTREKIGLNESDFATLKNRLTAAILNNETCDISFALPHNSTAFERNEVVRLIADMVFASPEFFFVTTITPEYIMRYDEFGVPVYGDDGKALYDCIFHFGYRDNDYYRCMSLYDIFLERAEEILRPFRVIHTLTDVEKALLLHDYLISICSLKSSGEISEEATHDFAYRADGVIIYRTATGSGYALAYAYMLERLGITCTLNYEASKKRVWNTVELDGEEYSVDLAADEGIFNFYEELNGSTNRTISHKAFLRSFDAITSDSSNIELYGVSWTSRPAGTKYDNAFWQDIEAPFCLASDKIYYLDKNCTIYTWDNGISEMVYDIHAHGQEMYNVRTIASDGANLYFNNFTLSTESLCRFNPVTKTIVVLDEFPCTRSGGIAIFDINVYRDKIYYDYLHYYVNRTYRKELPVGCDHNTDDGGVIVIPNCMADGIKLYTCLDKECECRRLEYLPAKNAHAEKTIYGKDATCTETGLTDGVICTVCNEILVPQKMIPAKGHLAYCAPMTSTNATMRQTSCITCGIKLQYVPYDDEAHPDITLIHNYKYVSTGSMHMESCVICGESGESSEHHYDSGKVTTEPTCGKAGVMTYTCADCFGTKTESIAASTKHDWELAEQTEYSTTQRCKGCGDYLVRISSTVGDEIVSIMVISAEHVPVITAAVAATCKSTGSSEKCYCELCGEVFIASYTLPKTDHLAVTDHRMEPTCCRTGLTEGSHCEYCGKVLVAQQVLPKTKHRGYCQPLQSTTTTMRKTSCITCGKQMEYVPHDAEANPDLELIHEYRYIATGSTHMQTCLVCGENGASGSHNYNSGKITTEATCVTKGVMTYTCYECGAKKTETLSYGDHTWELVEETEDSKTYCCKHCGVYEVYIYMSMENPKPSITIRPNEHIPVIAPAVPATCTSTGLSEGCYCRSCGEILVAQKTIPMILHTPVTDAAVAPTCTTTGLTEGTHCGVCNKVLFAQESVPMVAHTEGRTALLAPTCTEDGLTAGTYCVVCGEVLVAQQVLPAWGHSYTNGVCVCGEEQGVILDENIKMLHSLNLTSGIEINFVVSAAQLEDYDSYYLECVSQISGETISLAPVRNGNYYYFTLNKLTAFKMNDLYDATLHMTKDGAPYVSNVDSYSVAEYAYAQLNLANSGDKMKRLCANLLQYGAAAQTWKKYRLDALVTDAMTEVHKGYLTDPAGVTFTDNYKVLNDIENPQISIVRKTLSVESKIVVRYVVDATNYLDKLDQLSMRVTYQGVDGIEKTVILDECEIYMAGTNYYVFDLEALIAAELRTVISAAVYEGDTQISTTMQYSVESYGVPTTGTVRALCQAMLAYGDSAFAYFG